MFEDSVDARRIIRQLAVDEADTPMTDAQVQVLTDRLIPQFWIAPTKDAGDRPGSTRFGGAPDLPEGMAWPMRPIPPDAPQRVEELKTHFEWIAKHIARELPFEFLAQIDLAEAAKHPNHAQGVPAQGRLLFFWDGVVGLHDGGAEVCRVIWDTSPAADLTRADVPKLLEELEAAYDPSGRFKKPYVYPVRVMRLAPELQLPNRFVAEFQADPDLRALGEHDDHEESYRQLTAMDEGQFTTDGRNARRQRFLGSPDPEQDDPRFDSVVASGYPAPRWDQEQLVEATRLALQWRLLLQVDLGDLSQQDLTEGTVYFLIRNDDLASRDFSRVHAIYQQT